MIRLKNNYRIIVADPPWKYKDHIGHPKKLKNGVVKSTGGASSKYKCMETEDIINMDIKSKFSKNSILFLWTTVPFMEESFKVVHGWGYKYKTALFWIKENHLGMGWWFRNSVEVCLICKRGNIKAFRSVKPNTITERPTRHSKKPKAFWDLIRKPVLKLTPRLELFAREKRRGWDYFGNEIKDFT